MKNYQPQKSFSWLFSPLFSVRTGILGIFMFLVPIALSNLFGSVSGCACGNPQKHTLAALLRAQQTVLAESGSFATKLEDLEVPLGNETLYTIDLVEGEIGLVIAKGIDNEKNGTKDYIGGINYNPKERSFTSTLCIATTESNQYTIVNPTEAMSNYGIFREGEVKCEKGVEEMN